MIHYSRQSIRVHIVSTAYRILVLHRDVSRVHHCRLRYLSITTTTTSTTATNRQGIDTETILYLQKYGYLSNAGNNTQLSFEEGEIKQAISLFQEYYQIPGDGTLNNYTLYQMRKPRCGLADILHHEHNTGKRKWAKTHLTWNLHLADVHILITTAFAFSLGQRIRL